MATNTESFQATVDGLCGTLTPDQLSALSISLAAAAAKLERPASAEDMVVGSGNGVVLPEIIPTFPSDGTVSRVQRRMAVVEQTKQKRPLNAFIAFRTYYSPIFKGLPQKARSGLMRKMWGAENKRALWALLGSAYSDLRDHHKETLPVAKFLDAAIPLLPIVAANQYLSKMGWGLASDAAGDPILDRDGGFDPEKLAAEYPPRTNLSMENIVDHCYTHGLMDRSTRQKPMDALRRDLARDGLIQNLTSTGPPPPPSPPTCGGFLTLAVIPQTATTTIMQPSSPGTTTDAASIESPDDTAQNPTANSVNDDGEGNGEVSVRTIIESNAYLSVAAVTADQQEAFDNHALALHFHPDISPPILGFDPRIIQDDFDPFDLDLTKMIDFEM